MLLIVPHLNCNLFCRYCYERHYRKKHKIKMEYDLDLILKRMEELRDFYPEMCLHGGEPLMVRKEDVRKILLKMKELTGKSAIQTNGTLIDDDFIEIFKECSTSVGISYDGPGELSEYRVYRLKEDPKIDEKIEKMVKEKINVGIIAVISKANAGTNERLEKLKRWLLKLNEMRITGRLNPCGCAPGYELSEKRLKEVYLDLADFCLHHGLRWTPFIDIIDGLQGKPRVCVFMGCDIFHTRSAAELLGDGTLTNCMRANQNYILLRYPVEYDIRKEILSQTPQEFGGCQGCQYWPACYGGCPSAAIDGDWRNRTYLCPLWKALFSFYEKVLAHCGIPRRLCRPKGQFEEKQAKIKKPDAQHGDHTDLKHGDWVNHGDLHRGQMRHQDHTDSLYDETSPSEFKGESKEVRFGFEHGDVEHGDSEHGDWSNHGDSG